MSVEDGESTPKVNVEEKRDVPESNVEEKNGVPKSIQVIEHFVEDGPVDFTPRIENGFFIGSGQKKSNGRKNGPNKLKEDKKKFKEGDSFKSSG